MPIGRLRAITRIRPLRAIPFEILRGGADWKISKVKRFSRESTDKHTNGQTDGETDGRYQVFTVDNDWLI